MEHGDLYARITMSDEPSRLFRFWRSTLSEAQPESASVTIKKRNRPWHDWRSPDFYLHAVNSTERKLADISLSDLSLQLTSEEIEQASRLNDILWRWVGSRRETPVLDEPMPHMSVSATLFGPAAAVVPQIEALHDLEPLWEVRFLVAFTQGRPPAVDARTPNPMRASADFGPMMDEVATYAHMLAPGQEETLRDLGRRLAKLYRKRGDERRRKLQSVAAEVLGDEASEWLTTARFSRASPVHSVETVAFHSHMAFLESRRRRTQRPKRTHAWRAP